MSAKKFLLNKKRSRDSHRFSCIPITPSPPNFNNHAYITQLKSLLFTPPSATSESSNPLCVPITHTYFTPRPPNFNNHAHRSEVGIVVSLVMGMGKGFHDSLVAKRGVKSRDLSWVI